jgi:hypothetical protein
MTHHNPTARRFSPRSLIIKGIAVTAVAGAALLPGIASADGGARPRPGGPAAGGIWVPQGSPILGTTYGGDGETKVFEREQDAEVRPLGRGRAPAQVVDAADYVI